MWIKDDKNARYAFKAPDIPEDEGLTVEVPFPTQETKTVTLSSNAAEVPVNRATTILKLGTLAAASELTLIPGTDLKVGDRLFVNWTEPSTAVGCALKKGTDTLISATNAKGSNSSVVTKQLLWDGSTWIIL